MTNLGPLTTTFSPSSGCNSVIWGKIFTETIGTNTTTHKYHSLGLTSTSDCYPPNFFPTSAFYSPASICPSGWSSACGTVISIGTLTETQATCCPLGYSCIASTSDSWSTLSCSSAAISAVTLTVPDVSNQQGKVTVLDGPMIHAAAVNIRWQKQEFAPSTSAPPTTSLTTTSAVPSLDTQTTQSSGSPTGSLQTIAEGNQQLSVGVKAGIGVGVGVGVLLIGIILYLIYRLRNAKSPGGGQPDQKYLPGQNHGEPSHHHSIASPVMLPSEQKQEMFTSYNRHEAEAAQIYEAHSNARPSELPSSPYFR